MSSDVEVKVEPDSPAPPFSPQSQESSNSDSERDGDHNQDQDDGSEEDDDYEDEAVKIDPDAVKLEVEETEDDYGDDEKYQSDHENHNDPSYSDSNDGEEKERVLDNFFSNSVFSPDVTSDPEDFTDVDVANNKRRRCGMRNQKKKKSSWYRKPRISELTPEQRERRREQWRKEHLRKSERLAKAKSERGVTVNAEKRKKRISEMTPGEQEKIRDRWKKDKIRKRLRAQGHTPEKINELMKEEFEESKSEKLPDVKTKTEKISGRKKRVSEMTPEELAKKREIWRVESIRKRLRAKGLPPEKINELMKTELEESKSEKLPDVKKKTPKISGRKKRVSEMTSEELAKKREIWRVESIRKRMRAKGLPPEEIEEIVKAKLSGEGCPPKRSKLRSTSSGSRSEVKNETATTKPTGRKKKVSKMTPEELEKKRKIWRLEAIRKRLKAKGVPPDEIEAQIKSNPPPRRVVTTGPVTFATVATPGTRVIENGHRRMKRKSEMTFEEYQKLREQQRQQRERRRQRLAMGIVVPRRTPEERRIDRLPISELTPEQRSERRQKRILRELEKIANMTEEEKRIYDFKKLCRLEAMKQKRLERKQTETEEDRQKKRDIAKWYYRNKILPDPDRKRRLLENLKMYKRRYREQKALALGKPYRPRVPGQGQGGGGGSGNGREGQSSRKQRKRSTQSFHYLRPEERRQKLRELYRKRGVERKKKIMEFVDSGMTIDEAYAQLEAPEKRQARLLRERMKAAKRKARISLRESGASEEVINRKMEEIEESYRLNPGKRFRPFRFRNRSRDSSISTLKDELCHDDDLHHDHDDDLHHDHDDDLHHDVEVRATSSTFRPRSSRSTSKKKQIQSQPQPIRMDALVQPETGSVGLTFDTGGGHHGPQFSLYRPHHNQQQQQDAIGYAHRGIGIHHQQPQPHPTQPSESFALHSFSNPATSGVGNFHFNAAGNHQVPQQRQLKADADDPHDYHHDHSFNEDDDFQNDEDPDSNSCDFPEETTPPPKTQNPVQGQSEGQGKEQGQTQTSPPKRGRGRPKKGEVVISLKSQRKQRPKGYVPLRRFQRGVELKPGETLESAKCVICDLCGYIYRKPLFLRHRVQNHNPHLEDGVCQLCGQGGFKGVGSHQEFYKHFRDEHPQEFEEIRAPIDHIIGGGEGRVPTNSNSTSEDQVDGKHLCEECGRSYNSTTNLNQHVKRCHEPPPNPEDLPICDLCPVGRRKRFATNHNFFKHLRKQHPNSDLLKLPHLRRPKICGLCEQKFVGREEFIGHLESNHPGKCHPCKFCSNVNYTRAGSIFHLTQCPRLPSRATRYEIEQEAENEPEETRPLFLRKVTVPCEFCDRKQILHGMVRHYLESHDLKEDKMFFCWKCPKSTSRRENLAAHLYDFHGMEWNDEFVARISRINLSDEKRATMEVKNPEGKFGVCGTNSWRKNKCNERHREKRRKELELRQQKEMGATMVTDHEGTQGTGKKRKTAYSRRTRRARGKRTNTLTDGSENNTEESQSESESFSSGSGSECEVDVDVEVDRDLNYTPKQTGKRSSRIVALALRGIKVALKNTNRKTKPNLIAKSNKVKVQVEEIDNWVEHEKRLIIHIKRIDDN